jgi:rhodanese-related sulfurtransferase
VEGVNLALAARMILNPLSLLRLLPVIIVLVFGLVSSGAPDRASAQDASAQGYVTVSSPELVAMLAGKDFLLINVHVPYEGEIDRTDAFIAFDKIGQTPTALPDDKNAKIVLYCLSGRMSEIAARELARLGYTRVSHLAGGMRDWQAAGFQVIQKKQPK